MKNKSIDIEGDEKSSMGFCEDVSDSNAVTKFLTPELISAIKRVADKLVEFVIEDTLESYKNVTYCASSTALMIIDVQNAYLPVYNNSQFISNINILEDKARAVGLPIIYVRNIDKSHEPGSNGWKFHESITPGDEDYIIEKEYASSFSHTGLNELLDKQGIKNLVLTGLPSSGCYGVTARDSRSYKYKTIIVSDAHADQKEGAADALNKKYKGFDNVIVIKTADIIFVNKLDKAPILDKDDFIQFLS